MQIGIGLGMGFPKRSGGGGGAASLPTPSFGATSLAAWYDSAQFTYTDDVGYSSIAAMEDLSGNGFPLMQGDKALQPVSGASGGALTNLAGLYLGAPFTGLINGADKLSVWMRVKPRSDLYSGGTKRTLFAISEAAATASPPGSGSAVARFALYASGGTTNRKLYKTLSVKDGAQRTSSTTLGPQLVNDTFNTIGVQIDLTGGTAAVDGDDVLAIAGVLPRWQGVGMAWAWLGLGWRRHARVITDAVRASLDVSPYDRIEAGVRCDYARGHAWMQRLGFELETPLARRWGPDGADYSIYRRLK